MNVTPRELWGRLRTPPAQWAQPHRVNRHLGPYGPPLSFRVQQHAMKKPARPRTSRRNPAH